MTFSLAEVRALLALSEPELRERFGPGVDQDPESDYEGLEDVFELSGGGLPGSVYLRNGRVVLVYVPRAALDGVDPADIEGQLETEPARLRSRAGKTANLWVRPEEGVAYSADATRVHFVEVFPPSTLKEYKKGIYIDHGPFKR